MVVITVGGGGDGGGTGGTARAAGGGGDLGRSPHRLHTSCLEQQDTYTTLYTAIPALNLSSTEAEDINKGICRIA
ncbi:hypothetical protein E2C01_028591 [Portunus trituberculatus]|uniref:Uncharacterized protein n=1 Tax=Portunus trituberculatus TaxID=210409 RepID=A0A5B7EQE0_PORTR|nr:hypothetical protein [Portunus trituberculatus]